MEEGSYTLHMMLVDGNALAQNIQKELKQKVEALLRPAFFHVVSVGVDPVIENYLRYKRTFAEAIGVTFVLHRFPDTLTQEELVTEVQSIVEKHEAMIIQLPLPEHINKEVILNLVPPSLDVDVLSEASQVAFVKGTSELMPPVVGSILEVFDAYHVDLSGKNIVCVGEGNLVGKPMAKWLDRQGYPYSVITETTETRERNHLLKQADVVISGAGVPHMIKKDDVTEGVILIDAGTSESGARIVGDIDPSAYPLASLITPVPGGIGPLTIAILYRNVVVTYDE